MGSGVGAATAPIEGRPLAVPYRRTPEQRLHDREASRDFERQVAALLPRRARNLTETTDQLDFSVPGWSLEVKEKRQPYTARWHVVPGVAEVDLFVIDELSLRRALLGAPSSYFLLRDLPGGGRLFIASSIELAVAERARRNRVAKGKLIYDVTLFRRCELIDVVSLIESDLNSVPWMRPDCLAVRPVRQV